MYRVFQEVNSILEFFIVKFPGGIGNKLRKYYWKIRLLNVGKNAFIGSSTIFYSSKNIELGDNVQIGTNCTIDAGNSNGIYIGDDTAIAHNTYIRSANHKFDNLNILIKNQGHEAKKIEYNNQTYSIIIEDNVWIGANCTILSGSFISSGSVIAAGSLISNKIPENSIFVGNPGRVIAKR